MRGDVEAMEFPRLRVWALGDKIEPQEFTISAEWR